MNSLYFYSTDTNNDTILISLHRLTRYPSSHLKEDPWNVSKLLDNDCWRICAFISKALISIFERNIIRRSVLFQVFFCPWLYEESVSFLRINNR